MAGEFIIIVIIVIALYLIFKGDDGTKKRRKRRLKQSTNDPYSSRQTGKDAPRREAPRKSRRSSSRTNSSFIRSAKREESRKNYDEASDLYLKGNQVYSSAKMKLLKGPSGAPEAINLIDINAPDQTETITRNLVNEFYYRLKQPATAAAILRAGGQNEEAIAVEVAAGIPSQSIIVTTPNTPTNPAEPKILSSEPDQVEIATQETTQETAILNSDENNSDMAGDSPDETSKIDNISNTLMMASVNLTDACSVCKKPINAGDSFLQCLSCGKPGHFKHLPEMVKVTGKCPICRER